MKIGLALVCLLTMNAFAMDVPVSKKQTTKQIADQEVATLLTQFPLVADVLKDWGFIEVRNSTLITAFPENGNAAALLNKVLSYLQLPEDPVEKEDMIADLCTWVFEDTPAVKALIDMAAKKKDGSLKGELKKAFDEYRAHSSAVCFGKESRIFTTKLVSYFSLKMEELSHYITDQQAQEGTLFLLKKSLMIIYNYHRCSLPNLSFDQLNELIVTGGAEKNFKNNLRKALSHGFNLPLWNLAYFCKIKPLSKALLKALDEEGSHKAKEILSALPFDHLRYFIELMGKSNSVACLVALKLSLLNVKNPFFDPRIFP